MLRQVSMPRRQSLTHELRCFASVKCVWIERSAPMQQLFVPLVIWIQPELDSAVQVQPELVKTVTLSEPPAAGKLSLEG